MGQKVSPHGLRVGVIKDWDSKWFADKNKFADFLVEDNKVREFVKKKLYAAGVSKVAIERAADNKIKIIVMTAFDEISYAPRAKEAGAQAFVYKSRSLSRQESGSRFDGCWQCY